MPKTVYQIPKQVINKSIWQTTLVLKRLVTFGNTMDCVIRGLYGYGDTSIYCVLGLSFPLHILSLKRI